MLLYARALYDTVFVILKALLSFAIQSPCKLIVVVLARAHEEPYEFHFQITCIAGIKKSFLALIMPQFFVVENLRF